MYVLIHTHTHAYIYIYICVCVCVYIVNTNHKANDVYEQCQWSIRTDHTFRVFIEVTKPCIHIQQKRVVYTHSNYGLCYDNYLCTNEI